MKEVPRFGVACRDMEVVKNVLIGVIVSILAGVALLFGGIGILLSLIFFQNFHLPNFWHSFVLLYTVAAPLLSTIGLFIYGFRPSWRSATFSILASLTVGGILFLWAADGSRGLIH